MADGETVFDDIFPGVDGGNGHLVALGDILHGGDGGVVHRDSRALGDGMEGDDHVVFGMDLDGERHVFFFSFALIG